MMKKVKKNSSTATERIRCLPGPLAEHHQYLGEGPVETR